MENQSQFSIDYIKDSNILVVDDELLIREFFKKALGRKSANVTVCKDGMEAQNVMEAGQIDRLISDIRMPKVDGMELMSWIYGHYPITPVILLTAYATIENAVQAMKIGAFDYIGKPITDLNKLHVILSRALHHRRLLLENQMLKGKLTERQKFDRLVGPSKNMQRIFEIIETVAPTQVTVLVQGPSGTGKELVARAIHRNSPRINRPFIKVNCAAIPEGLIESELFGHEKGSFTNAIKSSKGKFEAANGGTILLDEIGDMPRSLQSKLLRILQEREFQKVGSNETIKVDFRLIATTNVDLKQSVKDGNFREDLFFRLNVIPITIPSLEERREDIPVLANHFIGKFNVIYEKEITSISHEVMRYLHMKPWPGNVRELENSIERAMVLCKGDKLELSDFFITDTPPEIPESHQIPEPKPVDEKPPPLSEIEKLHILSTLKYMEGHKAKTSDVLGISIRTLRNKLNEYRRRGIIDDTVD